MGPIRSTKWLVGALLLASCGGGAEERVATDLRVEPAVIQLIQGERVVLEVVATFDDGSEANVIADATVEAGGDGLRFEDGQLHGEDLGAGEIHVAYQGLKAQALASVSLQDLSLELEGELQPGKEARLILIGRTWAGEPRDISREATFSSSDPAVATVDEAGTIEVIAGGPVHFEASYGGETFTAAHEVTCEYPTHSPMVLLGRSLPALSWMVRWPDESESLFDLERVHCDAAWKDVESVAFILVTGWCGSCTSYLRSLGAQATGIQEDGMVILTVMIEDRDRAPASLDWSYRHVAGISNPTPGPVATDPENLVQPNYFRASRSISAYPTTIVVRTSDMAVIAKGNSLPLAEIAKDPSKIWD